MPAYVVADIEVKDPERYAAYMKVGPATVAQYGGRFLARGGTATALEEGWAPKRLVVIAFPDRAAALRWWDSQEYRAARKLREGAAVWKATLVDGL
jgi:uncharacterized protein (DUF1330 family)